MFESIRNIGWSIHANHHSFWNIFESSALSKLMLFFQSVNTRTTEGKTKLFLPKPVKITGLKKNKTIKLKEF